ncbi:hypothetical protein CHU92_00540 [Flavobacterium cyanobacteriorum]|uniref:LVIVD repeat-containing protein n=2 Tax=Flavobacterium cyanobacteriorum TaxID=2022802 RepID=A0A256A776_9FLAO|nr:hypothetical protein CHU92_00540 [Flavobacterium cyanobacteriorum]
MLLSCSEDATTTTGDGTGGSLAVFALKGNYLYTVDYNMLNVFSLSNTAQPVKVNEVFVGLNIETLFSFGEYLYIGSRNGMFIYSLDNPEQPQLMSAVQHFTACDPVVSNGDYSYVTLHSNTLCGNNINLLQVYNTANPQNPQLLHQRILTFPKGLGLYNNYLFVCDDEIKVLNVENPAQPFLVASINNLCFDVIIKDNDLFAIGSSGVYRYRLNPEDITDITLLSQVLF